VDKPHAEPRRPTPLWINRYIERSGNMSRFPGESGKPWPSTAAPAAPEPGLPLMRLPADDRELFDRASVRRAPRATWMAFLINPGEPQQHRQLHRLRPEKNQPVRSRGITSEMWERLNGHLSHHSRNADQFWQQASPGANVHQSATLAS